MAAQAASPYATAGLVSPYAPDHSAAASAAAAAAAAAAAGMPGVGGMPGAAGMGAAAAGTYYLPSVAAPSAAAVASVVKQALSQKEGPPGANLFIYNIPGEWQDHDLATAFSEFGNVLSARVFVDKNTGRSKCFGFVSYDAPEAAQAAIAVMDGFVVAGKHIKVSVKKGQQTGGAGAPY
eukprot:TRINITY_DN14485_c2_g3_i1.p2 TRINITY_DN14485_c2_g3~~TRINITY_DN14485_c2_g3_i1.p2  ORF type:complete len:196 (+),score=11.75 TRINITY_DN14485_c2_g3_i1:52-588(+)